MEINGHDRGVTDFCGEIPIRGPSSDNHLCIKMLEPAKHGSAVCNYD